jgi:hypothetical protein
MHSPAETKKLQTSFGRRVVGNSSKIDAKVCIFENAFPNFPLHFVPGAVCGSDKQLWFLDMWPQMCNVIARYQVLLKQNELNYMTLWCDLAAERRAQLARSRSRQNILSPDSGGSSGAVIREINFDPESSVDSTPTAHSRKRTPKTNSGSNNRNKNGSSSKSKRNGNISTRSEAEELLERLRAL